MFDGFVCACCGQGIYDPEVMEVTDGRAGKRYLICFDCAEQYTSMRALELIKQRNHKQSGSRHKK